MCGPSPCSLWIFRSKISIVLHVSHKSKEWWCARASDIRSAISALRGFKRTILLYATLNCRHCRKRIYIEFLNVLLLCIYWWCFIPNANYHKQKLMKVYMIFMWMQISMGECLSGKLSRRLSEKYGWCIQKEFMDLTD